MERTLHSLNSEDLIKNYKIIIIIKIIKIMNIKRIK